MILRSVIICPDSQLSQALQDGLAPIAAVRVGRTLNRYAAGAELIQAIRGTGAQLVFLSFQDVEQARKLARQIEQDAPGVQIVGVYHEYDPAVLLEIMRSGLREFLAYPFERASLMESLSHVKAMLERNPAAVAATEDVFSFLPAKPGVGASTLALNMSVAWSRRREQKTLLTDLDLNSGTIRFFLNLNHPYSVGDAIERAHEMDDSLWPAMVARYEELDVLHAGRINPNVRIDPAQITDLVAFLRRAYSILAFDLSGNLERYSVEIMRESKQILVVCTTEVAALHLAREKIGFLRDHGLAERARLVLNRVSKHSVLNAAEVEELIGAPVVATLANDYHSVARSISSGQCLAPGSDLGKQLARFADSLVEAPAPASGSPGGGKKKFLEFFTVAANAVPLQRRAR